MLFSTNTFTGIAFRSHSNEGVQSINFQPEKNYYRSDLNEGNFIGLIKLVAGFDVTLARHIKQCQELAASGYRNPVTFLSKSFINSALLAIREHMVAKIVDEINRNGGWFGLLMDGSQDVSSKEQISIVVRYVGDSNKVVEHTISFFNAKSTSGEALYESLRTILSNIGLEVSNIVGCSFDGASNMRGEFGGLQSFIKRSNENCVYVWCIIHRFNLAVNHVSGGTKSFQHILKITEDSAKMFRGSYIKMNIWDEVAKSAPGFDSKKRLKLIGTTRWSSKPKAVATIISTETNLFVLIKALMRLCSLKNLKSQQLENACANLNSWVNFENIVTTYILHKIFAAVDQTCIFLQKSDLCFVAAINCLKNCNQVLDVLKDQMGNYCEEANDFVKRTIELLNEDDEVQSHGIDIIRLPTEDKKREIMSELQNEGTDFITELQNRIKNILLHFDHKDSLYHEMETLDPLRASTLIGANEPIQMKKLCTINNVEESVAVEELRDLLAEFFCRPNRPQYASFLHSNINEKSDDEEIAVVIGDESDFDEVPPDVQFEYVKLGSMNEMCNCSSCILKYIGEHDERKQRYINIFRLYRYIATIPPTQVKCERDFSKMKLIKTRIRANLNDKSLENLMIISCESHMFDLINLDDILNSIVDKSEKISLYLHT